VSTFINSDITNGGRVLIAKGHLGKRIHFTRIVMGDGFLPAETAVRDMTDVVHSVVSIPISKMKLNADGTVVIGGTFSNADIDTPFFYRELALFAEGEDNAEVLYCYGNAGEFAERITPVGGSSVIEKSIDIVTAIGTAENVTATIVRTSTADEISFDDTKAKIGAASVQEAVELLAQKSNQMPVILISETEPGEPCEIWLKPTGGIDVTTPGTGGGSDPENPSETERLNFYLAHYYDKVAKKFVPFMYTTTAQSVLLSPGSEETVSGAITRLQSAGVNTLSELANHAGDTTIHTSAAQMDNVFTALGEFVLHAENTGIHLAPGDKTRWDGAAAQAAEALSLANAAGAKVNQFESRISRLEDGVFNNITGNPFSILFNDLAGITLTKGIWSGERARVEC
jgi:hypothetical protein